MKKQRKEKQREKLKETHKEEEGQFFVFELLEQNKGLFMCEYKDKGIILFSTPRKRIKQEFKCNQPIIL